MPKKISTIMDKFIESDDFTKVIQPKNLGSHKNTRTNIRTNLHSKQPRMMKEISELAGKNPYD